MNWSSERKETFIDSNLLASAIILYLQIPHTLTAADCFFRLGIGIYDLNPVTNFLLYSIDLLEVIPIFGITMTLLMRLKMRMNRRKSI